MARTGHAFELQAGNIWATSRLNTCTASRHNFKDEIEIGNVVYGSLMTDRRQRMPRPPNKTAISPSGGVYSTASPVLCRAYREWVMIGGVWPISLPRFSLPARMFRGLISEGSPYSEELHAFEVRARPWG